MICPTSSVVFGIFIVVAKKYEHLKPVAKFFNGVTVRKVDHETWGGYVCWSQEKSHNSQQDKMRDLVSS